MDFKVQHEIDQALWIYENNVVVFLFFSHYLIKERNFDFMNCNSSHKFPPNKD